MIEQLQLRIHGQGEGELPALIYLPGLHGDWTLVGSFCLAIGGRARFVEITYPRTLEWSLEDHAAAVENALKSNDITRGWLLAESFSSQVAWQLLSRKRFGVIGVILAGGFARHPMRWAVRLAEQICGGFPLSLLTRIMFGYAKVARYRYRHSPETLANLQEFIARRTELDRQAAKHRLHLVAQSDPCAIVRQANVPVYALSGVLDPIVPWFFVRRWLRRNCPALREYRIIWSADHNVLSTGANASAEHVLRWIRASSV